ncbi:MAG: hypothetical protein JXC32_10730 [Anaerolineae bacterium]|nr:hypothetical protein [Anaerolineae bacterium]
MSEEDQTITRESIDRLLAYLPAFEDPDATFIETWVTQEGTFPYPRYRESVRAFFELAGLPCWSDYGYNPRRAGELVRDDQRIAAASLPEVRTMLTYCVRGERFADGHWARMLELGRVQAILRRLAELRETAS